jgi:O-antigen ligase
MPPSGSRVRRSAAAARLDADRLAGLIALGTVAGLAADQGGYFPKTWGVPALVLLWAFGLTILFSARLALDLLDFLLLGGLMAFVAWTAASLAWSKDAPQTVLEIQRSLLYLALVCALLLLVRRLASQALLAGLLLATLGVSAYALATRLFPDIYAPPQRRIYDTTALSEPLAYSNALGAFAAVGLGIGLGFAAFGRSRLIRGSAGAGLVVLVTTLLFTLSRGAWLALAVGLAVTIALSTRRARLLVTLAGALPGTALAVYLASRADALVKGRLLLPRAEEQGHWLAVWLLGAGLLTVLGVIGAPYLERIPLAARVSKVSLRLCVGVLLAVVLVGGVRYGGQTWASFQRPVDRNSEVSDRFFSVSGTGRSQYWRVAWRDFRDHPVLGSGAGSYPQYWTQHRPGPRFVRDAHNLYLETLAELGPLGLILLLAVLGTPVVAAVRARADPFAAPALAGYTVFIVQAGLDWLWEMAAVTAAALVCACALVASARSTRQIQSTVLIRGAALVASIAAMAFVFVGLIGNSALAAAREASAVGDQSRAAEEARKATRWAPWASEPWRVLGESELAFGDQGSARADFVEGLARNTNDWALWYDLALVSGGSERKRALEHAALLNPRTAKLRRCAGDWAPLPLVNPSNEEYYRPRGGNAGGVGLETVDRCGRYDRRDARRARGLRGDGIRVPRTAGTRRQGRPPRTCVRRAAGTTVRRAAGA